MTKVSGFKELDAKLATLKSAQAVRVIKSAMLSAALVVEEKAVSILGAREGGSGALAESIGRKFVADTEQNVGRKFHVYIGPRPQKKSAVALHNVAYGRRVKGVFYGHLVEKGFTHPGGKSVAGQPFMLPALQQTRTQLVERFRDELGAGIERLIARNAKKGARGALRRAGKRGKRIARSVRRTAKRATRAVNRVSKRVSRLVRSTRRR